MTTVLVTGAGGFIGSRVATAAQSAGWRVASMLRPDSDSAPGTLIHDLAEPIAGIPTPDWVFHLAGAYAGANLGELDRADARFARNLVEWATEEGVLNWIIASAAEVYGAIEGVGDEDVPTRPVIPYGEIKLGVECVFEDFARSMPGARIVILRIGEVYGPHGRLVDELRARLTSGFCPWPGGGRVPVSFVHVDDVARAFLCATNHALPGVRVYNVADDEPATWRRFLETLARLLRTGRPTYLPRWLSGAFAAAVHRARNLTGHDTAITPNVVRLLTTPKALSSVRIRAELGFRAGFPNIDRGLEQVADALSNDA